MKRAIRVICAVLPIMLLSATMVIMTAGVAIGDPVPGTPPAHTPDFDRYLGFRPRISEYYESWLAYTESDVLPASAVALGFTEECGTGRCNAGQHLVADDPLGCATGESCLVYRNGCCFQVPVLY